MVCMQCPTCKKSYDADGYVEHHPSLFLCECETILRGWGGTIVPSNEVDLTGIDVKKRIAEIRKDTPQDWVSAGFFIKAKRWKKYNKDTFKSGPGA